MLELLVDDIPVTVRDVKQSSAEVLRTMKEYIDAKIEYELAVAANDPEYSGYHERNRLKGAEQNLKAIMSRAHDSHGDNLDG